MYRADVVIPARNVEKITLDAQRVYWVAPDDNAIRAAGKDGSSPQELTNSEPAPKSIIVDDQYVYWTPLERPVAGRRREPREEDRRSRRGHRGKPKLLRGIDARLRHDLLDEPAQLRHPHRDRQVAK